MEYSGAKPFKNSFFLCYILQRHYACSQINFVLDAQALSRPMVTNLALTILVSLLNRQTAIFKNSIKFELNIFPHLSSHNF